MSSASRPQIRYVASFRASTTLSSILVLSQFEYSSCDVAWVADVAVPATISSLIEDDISASFGNVLSTLTAITESIRVDHEFSTDFVFVVTRFVGRAACTALKKSSCLTRLSSILDQACSSRVPGATTTIVSVFSFCPIR